MPKNTQKKLQWEADEYLLCTHVDSDGYQYELFLTKREFDIGVKRAEKNPEDIPDYFIVLQGTKNKPEN